MDRRKLVLYLLLNVFISACVTGTILFWYDRNHSAALSPVLPAAVSNLSAPQPTLNPQVDIPIEIASVIGAGTLNAEWVVVAYKGDDQINLANWELRDENRHIFIFPQLVLHKDGAVQIHTASGTNTVIDLYWNSGDPIWESGEEAQLFDPSGNLRAVYKVP